jgi:hypothetical protein
MRDAGGVLGFGVAACAACCAGPILAFLGSVSILGFASTAVIGAVGAIVGVSALVAVLAMRRLRASAPCSTNDGPVAVELAPRR